MTPSELQRLAIQKQLALTVLLPDGGILGESEHCNLIGFDDNHYAFRIINVAKNKRNTIITSKASSVIAIKSKDVTALNAGSSVYHQDGVQ